MVANALKVIFRWKDLRFEKKKKKNQDTVSLRLVAEFRMQVVRAYLFLDNLSSSTRALFRRAESSYFSGN